MTTLSTSIVPGATSGGFGAFLAAIGQAPAGLSGEEAVGFERLLAVAPAGGTADPDNAMSDVPSVDVEDMAAGARAAPEGDEADTATTTAANLLIALTGTSASTAAGNNAGTAKTAKADTSASEVADAETGATAETGKAAAIAAVAQPTTDTSAPRDTARTAAESGVARPATAQAQNQTARAASAPAGDVPTARPAEGAPSMVVLFTQPAAQGAARIADAAQATPVAERLLDLSSDDVWIDQLARDIAATRSDKGDISFRLMPRHLGRLDVAMRMEGEGVSLKMDTQHEAAATIVHAAQGRLVDELRQQGVRVAGAEVTCTPGETGRQSGQGQGRSAAGDASHLIETASEHAVPRDDEDRTADRRGRFA